MTPEEAREIEWLTQTEDQPVGYFVEARIHYAVELHNAHDDYPLAAERLDVQVKMLSGNQFELRTQQNVALGSLDETHSKPVA